MAETLAGQRSGLMDRGRHIVVGLPCFLLLATAVYIAAFGVFDEVIQRVGALLLAGLILLIGTNNEETIWRKADLVMRAVMLLGLCLSAVWFFRISEEVESGLYFLNEADVIVAWVAIAVVVELARRTVGNAMVIVCILCLLYATYGESLPWIFQHAGVSSEELLQTLWYSFDGIFGRPMAAVTSTILIFIVFGGVLEAIGVDRSIVRLALMATARLRGGPAQAAVIASALFGTISGSAVANVVGTGVVTIPLIRRYGFSAKFAAAVEAGASTGGQIMPPIMGAVAFIMADITGISYLTICLAALIPALFYFGNLLAVIYTEAGKIQVEQKALEDKQVMDATEWRKLFVFVAPLSIIVVTLLQGASAALAGFWGVLASTLLGFALVPESRRLEPWLRFLRQTGRIAALLVAIVAAVGIVIGVMNLTGLGIRFASVVQTLSQGSLLLSLLLMAIACLVLGMGMPTVPAYLVIVLVMGPAVQKLGLSTLQAHLFVVYFGVLSAITPPVALAAFAAAPIAGANPIKVSVETVRLCVSGFLIPFAFAYKPALLLGTGQPLWETVWAVVALALALLMIDFAIAGSARKNVPRALLYAALGLAIIFTSNLITLAACGLAVLLIGWTLWQGYRNRNSGFA
ncbi:TRAP transporter fused permease subunit [Pelagibius sp. Alg239-R121]|uniref:TRAP transporter permease n=1 Tax=Pelagibius sp. Alg239-R121 TaxID=2993448 RepID=UPI0024A610EB|nr:TRAP transporter fused permease subunit [Pelagibius sp. Alg239-R121]